MPRIQGQFGRVEKLRFIVAGIRTCKGMMTRRCLVCGLTYKSCYIPIPIVTVSWAVWRWCLSWLSLSSLHKMRSVDDCSFRDFSEWTLSAGHVCVIMFAGVCPVPVSLFFYDTRGSLIATVVLRRWNSSINNSYDIIIAFDFDKLLKLRRPYLH